MRKYATHETIANTPHTELQHVNKHVKGKHTNTYKHTQSHIPNPEGHKHQTYHIHKTNHTEHQTVHTCKSTNNTTMQTKPETCKTMEHVQTPAREQRMLNVGPQVLRSRLERVQEPCIDKKIKVLQSVK